MSPTGNELEAPEHAPTGLSDDLGEIAPEMNAEHMQSFRAPPIEGIGGGADDVLQVDDDGQVIGQIDTQEAVEMMSKDAFFVVFRHSFGMPSHFLPDFRPLAIQPHEEAMARDASDAIFELLEIYYPNALMPQGDNFARIMVAAPFIVGKVMIVREILKARKIARMAPPPQQQAGAFKSTRAPEEAANDNEAPQAAGDPTAWMEQEVAA